MSDGAPLSAAVPTPEHIPGSVIYDFDFFRDPAYLADPHKRILEIVRYGPPGGLDPAQRRPLDVIQATRRFSTRTATRSLFQPVDEEQMKAMMASLPPGAPRIPQARPINLDPPEHTKYRAPLQKTFSPKSALALKDGIRTLANELIDKVVGQGRCDFVPAIAEQLPVQVFLKLFGLPLERQAEYRALAKEHLSGKHRADPKDHDGETVPARGCHAQHPDRAPRQSARRHHQHAVEGGRRRSADDHGRYGGLLGSALHRGPRYRGERRVVR